MASPKVKAFNATLSKIIGDLRAATKESTEPNAKLLRAILKKNWKNVDLDSSDYITDHAGIADDQFIKGISASSAKKCLGEIRTNMYMGMLETILQASEDSTKEQIEEAIDNSEKLGGMADDLTKKLEGTSLGKLIDEIMPSGDDAEDLDMGKIMGGAMSKIGSKMASGEIDPNTMMTDFQNIMSPEMLQGAMSMIGPILGGGGSGGGGPDIMKMMSSIAPLMQGGNNK